MHIAYTNASLNSSGALTGKIEYTPIAYNTNLTYPANQSPWSFAGINLSGFEFGKVIDPVTAPNLSEEDKSTDYTDLEATQTFIKDGSNTIRFPLDCGGICSQMGRAKARFMPIMLIIILNRL